MSTSASPLSGLAYPFGENGSGSGLALEPIQGNSLTQFIRSIEGLTAGQGQGILGAGLDTTQQGLGLTSQGLGLVPGGLAQAQSGATAAAPALQYLTSMVKGDQADLTQAAQPEIDQISQQFDAVRNLVSQQPRGGGKASVLAESPFQKATAVGNIEANLQANAAPQLGNLATNLAGVGLGEANVGLGAANVGLGEAGVGLGQEQVGQGLEGEAANIALTKEGQDYGQASGYSQLLAGFDTFI